MRERKRREQKKNNRKEVYFRLLFLFSFVVFFELLFLVKLCFTEKRISHGIFRNFFKLFNLECLFQLSPLITLN